jgi:K+-sensing histidine kinase KdpD
MRRLVCGDDGHVEVFALLGVTRDENASRLVIAHNPERGWRSRFDASFVDRLFAVLDGVNLHLVEPPR